MDWYPLDEDMIRDHVEPYPIELWNWGIENRAGHLKSLPRDIVRVNLLPEASASVTEKGIYFEGLYYTCDLAKADGWFVKARQGRRWKVRVAHDPRNMSVIYLRLDHGRRVEPCEILERSRAFRDRDLYECRDYWNVHAAGSQASATRKHRSRSEFNALANRVMRDAKERSVQALRANGREKPDLNIREHRADEKDLQRKNQEWTPAGRGKMQVAFPPDRRHKDGYLPPSQPVDKLRKLRRKFWKEERSND
jgi:hypothetical protein